MKVKSLSRVRLCATPETAAHQAPPSLGFSRQEHWSGLPFPSPMRESEVAQSCPAPSDPMDSSLPGSSVHGIFQARVLEWGAITFSDGCDAATAAKSLQSCPTLCDPIDSSPPGSPVPGILQARTLEWVAAENYIQYPVINHNEKDTEKRMYICITESVCCTAEINTTL